MHVEKSVLKCNVLNYIYCQGERFVLDLFQCFCCTLNFLINNDFLLIIKNDCYSLTLPRLIVKSYFRESSRLTNTQGYNQYIIDPLGVVLVLPCSGRRVRTHSDNPLRSPTQLRWPTSLRLLPSLFSWFSSKQPTKRKTRSGRTWYIRNNYIGRC